MTALDHDRCYRAVQSRDRRFDGWFVTAVVTTRIYCRPSCPAVTPKAGNVEFFPTAAAAQQRGYRACKRCRPDATPGSPEWNVRGDVVARAMRLVVDGVVDREGVSGLARRLSYSERHLTRLLTDELGAGPLAIARAQRAHTARILIETTDMELTSVAFAAGFGSVRQFNDTVRLVFGTTPSALRATAGRVPSVPVGAVELELARREPFDGGRLAAFLAARAVPGVEAWDGDAFHRSLALPHGHGVAVVAPAPRAGRGARSAVTARLRLADWRDLGPAVRRIRRLLDVDADPCAVDAALADDPVLAPSIAAVPGLRVPGSVDPFETAVRAIIGQQISVAGARTVTGRIVAAAGTPLSIDGGPLTHVFPSPAALAALDPASLPMPRRRALTIVELATRVADGRLVLDAGADRAEVAAALSSVPGIGPWTAGYVLMRGLGDPDVFLPTDLGVRAGLARLGISADRAQRWRPWRSYALHHLWAIAGGDSKEVRCTRAHVTIDSPVGPLTLIAEDGALREIRFPNAPPATVEAGPADPTDPVLADAARQLAEYFGGTRLTFDLPLAPAGTPFQLAAWCGLTAIPYGETVSYGEQARRLGHDGKARAVGAANGRNPLPIVIPCHRVVGSDGSLVGFGGGVETKAWLLHHERRVIGVELPLS